MTQKPSKKPATRKAATVRRPKEDLVQIVRDMLVEDLDRCTKGTGLDGEPLSPTQHRLLRGQIVNYLERLGKLTGDTLQIPEWKIVKLPAFRRVVASMRTALEPWPEAMFAIADVLDRAERGETAATERTGT